MTMWWWFLLFIWPAVVPDGLFSLSRWHNKRHERARQREIALQREADARRYVDDGLR